MLTDKGKGTLKRIHTHMTNFQLLTFYFNYINELLYSFFQQIVNKFGFNPEVSSKHSRLGK